MTWSTLMVHLDLGHSNDARLRIAVALAEQFDATLIGVCACEAQPSNYAEGEFAQGLVERARSEITRQMSETEQLFRTSAQRLKKIEWRCATSRPIDCITAQARAADLIIAGVDRKGLTPDLLRRLNSSDLLMQVGRPVFIVPPDAEQLNFKCAVVAWKDTREARRAVADALPLLRKVKEVAVVEAIEDDNDRSAGHAGVDDVVSWLARHGISAFGRVLHVPKQHEQVDKISEGADFIVAGAYGHQRMREWVFGGFTRDLLTRSQHYSLLAH